ncbi:Galactosylgalactosylxylosylprotein 3-beta-glucuronosyltransferase S [Armadillidium vulgare]|nr:Galactosylgalactosylxylosylprotein 3-beta-glucuronosyltransferase S [Armadillidium vulgare]
MLMLNRKIYIEAHKYICQWYRYFWGMTKCQQIGLAILIIFMAYLVIQIPALIAFSGEINATEFRKLCSYSFERTSDYGVLQNEENSSLPIIYIVTPTYHRPEMAAELIRIGQTLLLVPKVHWIVAEDKETCSDVLFHFLKILGLPYTHFASPMPDVYRSWRSTQIPRGVSNRRAAIEWVKEHGLDNGVLYFLDDDNTINIKLFEEMRYIKKVAMWPVGLIDGYSVSSPIIGEDSSVIGFFDAWEEDENSK